MRDKLTSTSGITLISLVVTIIIILILSTISIRAILGEDGILKQSEQIKEMQENSTAAEEGHTDKVLTEYKYASDKWTLTKDEEGVPIVVKGDFILKVGDYINYDPTAELSEDAITYYKSEESKNGYGKQEFYLTGSSVSYDTETYGWRVLGADDKGQLLIVSEDFVQPITGGVSNNGRNFFSIGSTTDITKAQAAYVYFINELNSICSLYGQGKHAVRARSIQIEDINNITGYNPEIAKYNVGKISEYGNEITYTSDNDGKITYIGSNGVSGTINANNFYYYDNSSWKKMEPNQTISITNDYYSYNKSISTSVTDYFEKNENSQSYKTLFMNSSDYYWTASKYKSSDSYGTMNYGMTLISQGNIGGGNLFSSNNNCNWTNFTRARGIRPVVTLKAGITLKDSKTTIDGCTLWNIQ